MEQEDFFKRPQFTRVDVLIIDTNFQALLFQTYFLSILAQ